MLGWNKHNGKEEITRKLSEICSPSNENFYEKGEVIYQPGDLGSTIYHVQEGKIKLAYLDESGRKLTLSILGKGEFFGEMVLIRERKREFLAQVLQDAVLYEIKSEKFFEFIEKNPSLALGVIELFGRRTREIEKKLEDLVFKDIPTRLSRQLLKLIKEHGKETKSGVQINFKITHKELADLIGSARENTTTALNHFAKEGILDKKRYEIIVKDEKKLKEKSGTL